MLPVDRGPLGMYTTLLSGVTTLVAVMLISVTVPEVPCASMKSSTLKGRVTSSSTPPAMLERAPFTARPIHTPKEVISAVMALVSMPR